MWKSFFCCCHIVMPSEDAKIWEFNQKQKPFIIYTDFKYLIENIDGCKNDSENSSTSKVREHIQPGFPISAISSLK